MKNINQRHFTEHLFKSVLGRVVLLCLPMLFISAQQAFGVSCHCFKERNFKPSQPASADPYILATTRNSFLAAASGIDKGTVVRQRMTGTTETDLWLSRYLSTRVDRQADQLLRARDSSSSWSAALDAVDLDTGSFGAAFQEARKTGDADGMARALADPVLGRAFNAGEPTLGRLRHNGANIAEAALSLYLAARLKRTPESLLAEVGKGKQTWGSLFNSLGIKIDTVGDVIAEAVTTSAD
jgi:hypothetical protein